MKKIFTLGVTNARSNMLVKERAYLETYYGLTEVNGRTLNYCDVPSGDTIDLLKYIDSYFPSEAISLYEVDDFPGVYNELLSTLSNIVSSFIEMAEIAYNKYELIDEIQYFNLSIQWFAYAALSAVVGYELELVAMREWNGELFVFYNMNGEGLVFGERHSRCGLVVIVSECKVRLLEVKRMTLATVGEYINVIGDGIVRYSHTGECICNIKVKFQFNDVMEDDGVLILTGRNFVAKLCNTLSIDRKSTTIDGMVSSCILIERNTLGGLKLCGKNYNMKYCDLKDDRYIFVAESGFWLYRICDMKRVLETDCFSFSSNEKWIDVLRDLELVRYSIC